METHNEVEGRENAPNVVRIRRDWFGPTEELVPIGPRAKAGEVEAASSGDSVGAGSPVDPDAFWGESSNSIQDVVEVVGGGEWLGGDPRRILGARFALRGSVGRRTLIGSLALGLIAGVSVVGLFLASPGATQRRAAIASIGVVHTLGGVRHLGTAATTNAVRKGFEVGRMTRARHTSHKPTRATHTPTVTPVVYHPSYSSSPTYATATANPQTQPAASGSGTPSAVPASQPSTPAFGASSALGPMSSPDG